MMVSDTGPEADVGRDPGDGSTRDEVIGDEVIRLGQLMKLASMVEDGGEAKAVIDEGMVLVNGEVERRRGRQLRHGDVVSFADQSVRVVSSGAANEPVPPAEGPGSTTL